MKKSWLYGVLALVMLVLCSVLAVYLHLQGQQRAIKEKGSELALTRTQMNEVTFVNTYYGKQDYIVVEGKTESGEKLVAWFHGDQGEVEKMSRLIPKENVLKALNKDHPNMQLSHIIPAKQDNKKVWEVLFTEGNDFYYYYIDMYNGKLMKRYKLPKMNT
ncbi:DUF5590 domain-containing protein [Aneurinibacillus aneurinilyticus]|uniref:Peptidase propeptide and YPEB domain protein n=1 Tax=Aneurinibacillus aneurinilyticus ATCC 12856 TaxID=649747 RepID=U1YC07_ANEAE|nr:DUF5590 domain-containing protein [Aneurinibacillus aneurinilyticus]ERI08316.1 peptidase propeptide and YPEB domain protein [Aneurinibacillus aneurinilyticus ATCC 12856]MED0705729.1 DUF5590 domain-containing protein [Aneurinibacillus aneurinilyticus]MED0725802.1 DUF5590 domain-containing protein [Aneurinibacillus aneurinilyticus]MED0732149.1 DUF5590 domain-containing protein [Aneurinibacillus aneurinilyticus]MED0740765.1 DUF5590 domain-containing protein [Aneurinibacillus aneurinilyticus]